MATSKVERAHQMYREGNYEEALGYYSEALSFAKTVPQKIALHSNRAACFLKLHDFKQAAEECTSVLELDHEHTGALMLRAQTLVTLKEYQSALFDVNRLLELNPSSEVYLNLQARLKTQVALAPIPEAESELEEADDDSSEDMSERDEELQIDSVWQDKKVDIEMGTNTIDTKVDTSCNGSSTLETNTNQQPSDPHSGKQEAIPKPKGHSRLDYSRWDRVVDDSSDDDDEEDEEDTQPQYRFRVKTVDIIK